jgi:hypothetical protein
MGWARRRSNHLLLNRRNSVVWFQRCFQFSHPPPLFGKVLLPVLLTNSILSRAAIKSKPMQTTRIVGFQSLFEFLCRQRAIAREKIEGSRRWQSSGFALV